MKKKIILIGLFILIITSCEKFILKFENYVESVKFEQGKYRIEKEGMDCIYLIAEPSDSFNYYEAEYEISNHNVCAIVDESNNYIFIKGLNEGSAIITAKICNKTAKCIIEVY